MKREFSTQEKVEKAELKLQGLLENTSAQLSNRVGEPLTDEDIKIVGVEFDEVEIADIIHQVEISIYSPDGNLKVPVYLDENFEWYFKRESLIPGMDVNQKKMCFKTIQTDTSSGHKN